MCAAKRDAAANQTAISGAATAPVPTAERGCGCERVLLRPRRGCAREANWAETRQQEVQWGALLSRELFRRDMMPVLGCTLERVILQHRLRRCTAADTYTRQHQPKQAAGGEFNAALHRYKSSCCLATLLFAQ